MRAPSRKETLRLPAGHDAGAWHYRSQAAKPLARMHRHDELELNLVLRGSATYLVADRRLDLRPHTLIWLFPAQDHLLIDQSADYQMWILVFRRRMLERCCLSPRTEPLLESDPVGQFCKTLLRDSARRLAGLFAELGGLTDPDTDAARFNAGCAYALLTAWDMHLEAGQVNAGIDLHPAVDQAARLIRDTDQPLGIEELARQCGVSPSRLSRLFKAQTGVWLVHYRQRLYLERFLELYQTGRGHSLTEASLRAGFGSYPQFHRVFKRIMGCSPAQYRRTLREG